MSRLPEVRAAVDAMSANVRMTPAHVEALREQLDVILGADARIRELDYQFVAAMSERIRPVLGVVGAMLGSSAFAGFLHLIDVVNIEPSGIIIVAVLAAIVAHSMLPDRREQGRELEEAGGRLRDLAYDLRSMDIDPAGLMEAMKKAVPAIVQATELHRRNDQAASSRLRIRRTSSILSGID